MRRPAAPREPGDVVWADSVASLFTAAARRAATSPSVKSMPWSLAPRSALPLPCYTVPWDARSFPYKRMQLLQAAVIASSTPTDSTSAATEISRSPACWPCPSSRYIFRLRPNIGGSLGTAASLQSQRRLSEPGRWVGTLLRFGPARPRAKRRTSFASGVLCNSAAARLEPSSMFPS